MLIPDNVRIAIILCKRAPLKGEEAKDASNTIDMLETLYDQLTAPPPDIEPPKEPKKHVKHPRPDK